MRLHPPSVLILALLAASAATAAPREATRERAVPEPGSACGTALGSAAEAVSLHLERGPLTLNATPHSTDAGEIAVLEDDGTFFFDLLAGGSRRALDVAAVTRAFYRTHGDDYDVLAIYGASGVNMWLGSPTALAAAYVVRNQIQGIGLDTFDYGAEFGSPARLENALVMNGLHRYAADPRAESGVDQFSALDYLAHEFGHRWLSYVYVDSAGTRRPALLGRSRAHWSFRVDTDASVMEGCSWARVGPDTFVTDSVTTGFGGLDLYLMGLASAAETDSVLKLYDATDWNPPAGPGAYGDVEYPQVGVSCDARPWYWKVEDIVREEGARVPDAAAAPHAFRVAFVLVVPAGSPASAADLQKLESLRAAFVPYFHYATRGRGTMDATLDSRAGRVAIAHEPLADTEDTAAPRAVGARITIEQGGIPIALDPSSPRAFWRVNGGGWNETPLTAAGADSFAGSLPGPGAAASVEYYLYAASDSAGIEAFDPPSGALAPYLYGAGPDTEPPAIVHVPVRAQGRDRMPQPLLARITDNAALDSAWIEYRVNGAGLQSAALAPAGRDSFTVSIGAGLPIGSWVAYRFVARDAAAAANHAWSNPGWDTLRVQKDWLLDFENGPDGTSTDGIGTLFRRLWHFTRTWSSPAGGSAWRFGSRDSTPYPPHSGGYLYLPPVPMAEPGLKLRFDHRYAFEASGAAHAWDGVYLEARGGSGPWQVITPAAGYPREFRQDAHGLGLEGKPCWSGRSAGWTAELFDLSAFAGSTVLLRFFVYADDFLGDLGWWLDHVRLEYPNGVVTGVGPAEVAWSPPWPNPARAALRQRVAAPSAAEVEWSLYDLQGRKVAALWKGRVPAGGQELEAAIPETVRPGLYFSRLRVDGREASTGRIAVVR